MSKLQSALSFLKLCFSNTSEVLKNLYNFTEETASKNIVVKKHQLKDGLPTIDLLDILPGFNETVEDYTFLEGTSYITDLALLKGLAKKHENAQYFEFGTWRGKYCKRGEGRRQLYFTEFFGGGYESCWNAGQITNIPV